MRPWDHSKHQTLYLNHLFSYSFQHWATTYCMRTPFRATLFDLLQNGSCYCHLSHTCGKLTQPIQLALFTSPLLREEQCGMLSGWPQPKMPKMIFSFQAQNEQNVTVMWYIVFFFFFLICLCTLLVFVILGHWSHSFKSTDEVTICKWRHVCPFLERNIDIFQGRTRWACPKIHNTEELVQH